MMQSGGIDQDRAETEAGQDQLTDTSFSFRLYVLIHGGTLSKSTGSRYHDLLAFLWIITGMAKGDTVT